MQSDKSLYVNGKSVQNVTGKSVQFSHGRVPKEVVNDRSLSLAARVVYASIAVAERDGKASVGQRLIARSIGIHQETAMLAIRELQEAGHIEVFSRPRARSIYRLTHGLFQQEHKGKNGAKPRCLECGKLSKTLNETGWCYSCRTRVELLRELKAESAA